MDELMQMLLGSRPQTYYGTQTADQVNADASRAQQAAMQQADINSRNYAADRDFWGKINQMFSDQNLAKQQSGYAQELAGINNAAAMDQAKLAADTQRYATDAQKYGYDQSLAGQMAGYDTQRQIADLNAQMQRYTSGLNAATGLQQTQMQTNAQMLPAQLQQQRYNDISPLVKGLLQQYATPQNGFAAQPAGGYSAQPGAGMGGGASPQSFPKTGDFFIDQYNQAIAEGRLDPGTPAPYSPNGFWTDQYLQNYLSNPNAKYGGGGYGEPAGEPGGTPQANNSTGSMDYLKSIGYTPPQVPAVQGQGGAGVPGIGGGGTMAAGGGMSQSGGMTNMGGIPTPPPAVQSGDVITQQMQNQMINQAQSQNAKNYAGATAQAQSQLAGRGWNPRGPGMQYNNQMQNAAYNKSVADTQAYYQVPMQAAQANAQYKLGAAGANTANNSAYWNAYTQQQGQKNNQLGTLLGALTGLV